MEMNRRSFIFITGTAVLSVLLCGFDFFNIRKIIAIKTTYASPVSEYPGRLKPLNGDIGNVSKWKG